MYFEIQVQMLKYHKLLKGFIKIDSNEKSWLKYNKHNELL